MILVDFVNNSKQVVSPSPSQNHLFFQIWAALCFFIAGLYMPITITAKSISSVSHTLHISNMWRSQSILTLMLRSKARCLFFLNLPFRYLGSMWLSAAESDSRIYIEMIVMKWWRPNGSSFTANQRLWFNAHASWQHCSLFKFQTMCGNVVLIAVF